MISAGYKWKGRRVVSGVVLATLFFAVQCATARLSHAFEAAATPVAAFDRGGSYDHYAKFIAGMGVPESSPLAKFQSKPTWVEYSKHMDAGWTNLNKRLLGPIQHWSEKELGAAGSTRGTVYYPLSGPDFVNMNAFFPRAKTYVMVALEPLGEIPMFNTLDDKEFKAFFQSMKSSVHDLLSINYFISAHMNSEIEDTEVGGVLPVLLLMLARSDAKVLDVRYITMGIDGRVKELPALGTTAKQFPALGTNDLDLNYVHGIRITFNGPESGSNSPQTLYYFRVNLEDQGFKRNKYFLSFLRNMAPFTSFLKSASYVLYDSKFSAARQFVLDHSRYVIQEDSGIPLKYFDPSLWEIEFHGRYSRPISTFSQKHQESLASVYRTDKKIKPLPFGFGYYYKAGESNLMFASRKTRNRGRDEAPISNSDDKHFLYNSVVQPRWSRGS